MDLIDDLSANHGALRGALVLLGSLLVRPGGCGWDDLMALDTSRLSKELAVFQAALKTHDAIEAAYLERVLNQFETDHALIVAIADGHRAVGDMTRLFSVVAALCDGEHVHRLRTVLERLREEVEAHLAYEERVVFPRLRERLSQGQLQELGRRAHAITRTHA